jgi:hypothetical protein
MTAQDAPMTRLRLLCHTCIVLALAGCSPHRDPENPRPRSATLRVDNRGWTDVIVYLADGNVPLRLGRVGSLERTRLAIPNGLAAVGVVVRSVGSGQVYAASPMLPGAGGTLELVVQPLLAQSTLAVRPMSRSSR